MEASIALGPGGKVACFAGHEARYRTSGHCPSGQLALTWFLSLDGAVPLPRFVILLPVGTPKDHNGPSLRDWGRSPGVSVEAVARPCSAPRAQT